MADVTVCSPKKQAHLCWSPQVRFGVMFNHGGLWLDADSLLLRDLSPLWAYEFGYAWSPRLPQHYNTAVLRFFEGVSLSASCSPLCCSLSDVWW